MIYLSIGSNLNSKFGDRFENIRRSLKLLENKKLKILKVSKFYETPSYPNKKLPKFINIAVKIDFLGSPIELLKLMNLVEKKMDRVVTLNNEPRTLDIDIIDFKSTIINTKSLTLPHPRTHERNFVLMPLYEICPDWKHPVNNLKIDVLIKNLTPTKRNEITRIKESVILEL